MVAADEALDVRTPRGVKRVAKVNVRLGDNEYELVHDQGRVVTRRRNVVRGVALKTEQLPMETWIDELSSKLVDEAGQAVGVALGGAAFKDDVAVHRVAALGEVADQSGTQDPAVGRAYRN